MSRGRRHPLNGTGRTRRPGNKEEVEEKESPSREEERKISSWVLFGERKRFTGAGGPDLGWGRGGKQKPLGVCRAEWGFGVEKRERAVCFDEKGD